MIDNRSNAAINMVQADPFSCRSCVAWRVHGFDMKSGFKACAELMERGGCAKQALAAGIASGAITVTIEPPKTLEG